MSLGAVQCCVFPHQIPPTNKDQHSRTHHQQQQDQLTQIVKPLETSGATAVHKLLDQIPLRDTFAWNTLLRSHLTEDNPRHAILVYRHMLLRGARPDRRTLPHVLTASRLSAVLFNGKQVHAHALKLGLASDPYVVTSLMELYARFEGAQAASVVFDRSGQKNPVLWTLLAKLYLMEHKPDVALQVFHKMVVADAEFDPVALVTASKACEQLKSLHDGRKVHEIAIRKGLELDVLVGNSLLNMYIECGRMIEEARAVFDRMPSKDAVSWTTIIRGYVQNGGFNEGLKLFRAMCSQQGVMPDAFTVSAVLPACARMAARKHGREIHGHVVRHDIPMNLAVLNALMDMYMKSASVESAARIFHRMLVRDAISWTVMILGYSLHGQGELGLSLFRKMEEQAAGVLLLDRAAYTAALHACTTALKVEEGRILFDRIVKPEVEHCALMVSLLSRAGQFDEARAFVDDHQMGSHAVVLRAILSGCRIHQNVRLGKRIAEQLIELEPLNAENYVLLSNVYAASAKWDAVKETRETIRDMGLKPKSGCSWIEVRSKVHVFGVGDVSHPRSERIYWELQSLMKRMQEEEGYLPEEDFSLHDVDEERECVPYGHSEMLAIAFGLISTQASTTVRVTKNLRVCRNCHASAKMISKIVEREIVLKDPDGFHHFRNGSLFVSERVSQAVLSNHP